MLTGKKLISQQEKDGIHEFIIETGAKLGDVFTELPAGIVNKTETGIGATTLEIEANRNSIIVEPVKVTASTKAKKHDALYVGSGTKLHPGKISKKQIAAYINDKAINPKKIIVVADSLAGIIECIGKNNLQNYFLMIDEADAFQLDSSYRTSMETVFDIYKLFPESNRCLVTATMLDFSDPELENEKKSRIQYENPTKRKIHLVHSDEITGTAVDIISNLINQYPEQKILIAYNHVQGCYNIARHLIDEKLVPADLIKILCSSGSKIKVGELDGELEENMLPGIINFVTSAYFSGYDLEERFHLISVSDGTSSIFRLSEHRLKQIAGRCRLKPGLFTETIIYKVFSTDTHQQDYTKMDLVDAAHTQIKALDCVDSHYTLNKILRGQVVAIRKLITENTTVDQFQFLRKGPDDNYAISYLNIDSFLESQRVKHDLYTTPDQLPDLLITEGNEIKRDKSGSNTVVQNQNMNDIRDEKIKSVIEELRKLKSEDDVETLKLQRE